MSLGDLPRPEALSEQRVARRRERVRCRPDVCAALSSSACASMTLRASFMQTRGGIVVTEVLSARGSDLLGMLPVSDRARANFKRGSVNNASKTSGTSAGGFI
jgi:hypothetical protein